MTQPVGGSPRETPLRALLLTFEFPPVANGGVFRALGLAETLPDEGVELDIVTVREGDYREWAGGRLDEALTARVPSQGVCRTSSGFPGWYWRLTASKLGFRIAQYLYLGDPVAVFWRASLIAGVERIVRARAPHVILATAPPFGVAVLARTLARRHWLPWVIDWRDPWSLWCAAPFPSYAHYRYARFQEHRLLREANASVATSHVTRDDWTRTVRGVDPHRLVTVYNGFDRQALATPGAGPAPAVARQNGHGPSPRRIVYVGSFYYAPRANEAALRSTWRRPPQQWLLYSPRREDWRFRSPYYFLRGLRRFAERCPELANRVRIEFAGSVPDWLPGMLDETGTTEFAVIHGPVSHGRSIELQRTAAAVLLTSARVIGGRDYSIAGKVAEYFGLRRPILGVLTDGAMRDIVERSGLGLLADPEDADAIATQIGRIASATPEAQLVTPNDAFLAQFERRATAREMATVLRRAANEGYRG